jgi:transposase
VNRLPLSDQHIVKRYFAADQPTTAMLAAEFDCDAATIGNRIKAAGYELRPSNNIQRVIVDAKEARRLHDKEGLSQDEIASRLKCSRPVVGRALRKARVKTRRGGALKKIYVDRSTLRRMIVEQKMQYRDIANILNCSKGTVARMRKEAAIPKAKQLTPEERKERRSQSRNRWRAANIERVRRKDNEYVKRRRQENPNARLASTLRGRLRTALKNNVKRGSAVRDLGMDIASFRKYIESLWAKGMSWENYGNRRDHWSLDHIFPLDEVDLFDRVQFLAANNWQNLQPLWSPENVRKGNSVSRAAAKLFQRLCRHFGTLVAAKGR